MFGNALLEYDLTALNELTVVIRILLATLCGFLLGIERSRKLRAAGSRTYACVCLGAAMTMMTGQFLTLYVGDTDVARLGAQVVSGIGFIGAGTIIVTGYHKVKGVTTAAGLWASACMGLAIGAGFYFGGIMCCIAILFIVTLLDGVQNKIVSHCTHLRLFVIYDSNRNVLEMIKSMHDCGLMVDDFEMLPTESKDCYGVVMLVKSLTHRTHQEIIDEVRNLGCIVMVAEM